MEGANQPREETEGTLVEREVLVGTDLPVVTSSSSPGDQPPYWTPQRELCAFLSAEGLHNGEYIAKQCGIGHSTVYRWQQDEYHEERVRTLRGAMLSLLWHDSIAEKQLRVMGQVSRSRALQSLVHARSVDPEIRSQPGGDTGYLKKALKVTPGGEVFEEWSVDYGLLKEQARLDVLIAKELGQLVEKSQVQSVNVNVNADTDVLTPDQREAVRRMLTGASEGSNA